MSDGEERLRKLRHDIANPLSAILAEAQLLLLSPEKLDAETLESLKRIEALVRRSRDLLNQS